jgi:Family of unknown function (DUF5706)
VTAPPPTPPPAAPAPPPPPVAPPPVTPPPGRTPTAEEAVETAWHIHTALGEWTTRVDSKASFALTLEAAALAGVAGLTSNGGLGVRAMPASLLVTFSVALLSILASALCAMMVVVPRMRGHHTAAESGDNFIYFGHLRHWSPGHLHTALTTRDPLPMLSRQLVVMSHIAWRKHRWVELSFILSAVGATLLSVVLLVR